MTIRTDIHRPSAITPVIAAGKGIFYALLGTMLGLLLWKFLVMVVFLWDLIFDWFKLLGI